MAQESYRPTSFGPEPLRADKLNQVSNNVQWLFENTPRMLMKNNELTKADGLKIASGRTWYTTATWRNWNSAQVSFGNFFSAGSVPVITATVNPTQSPYFLSVSIGGLNQEVPDHRGFTAYVVMGAQYANMVGPGGWLNWTAIGY